MYIQITEHTKKRLFYDSIEIRENFNWENIGKIGFEAAKSFYEKVSSPNYIKPKIENEIKITFFDGPKVEITGEEKKDYNI